MARETGTSRWQSTGYSYPDVNSDIQIEKRECVVYYDDGTEATRYEWRQRERTGDSRRYEDYPWSPDWTRARGSA